VLSLGGSCCTGQRVMARTGNRRGQSDGAW